ncbi:MAG TPA: type II toxin-antitoxin system VapC family toxin [Microvirga sp.]|jgi:predicted nucleic-acid-binding protein|nr:type II toxin-antitoxin system VapC family toxin [Microvirga sp.]
MMIGLDSNILLRALTEDDPVQTPVAARILTDLTPERPGYVNLLVLAETAWSLARRYKAERETILEAVEGLLESRSIVVAERAAVIAGVELARSGEFDFADALIAVLNRQAGCDTTLTFDAKASKTSLFTPAA